MEAEIQVQPQCNCNYSFLIDGNAVIGVLGQLTQGRDIH